MKSLFEALNPPRLNEERTGQISQVLALDRYRIEDDMGRIYDAESATTKYAKGAMVRTIGRQIVGSAGRSGTPKVYQV